MPYCHRIDTSEGIDVNKTRASTDKGIKVKGLSYIKGLNFNQLSVIVINLNIHCADYRCIINGISKNEAINLLRKKILISVYKI